MDIFRSHYFLFHCMSIFAATFSRWSVNIFMYWIRPRARGHLWTSYLLPPGHPGNFSVGGINVTVGHGDPHRTTVYPKKYAYGFCFAVLCCGYTLTDFPISIRLTSLALWQSNDCPSASNATLMNMDKYFMWIHYERLHNHNKTKHNKTVCIFLGIYCK